MKIMKPLNYRIMSFIRSLPPNSLNPIHLAGVEAN